MQSPPRGLATSSLDAWASCTNFISSHSYLHYLCTDIPNIDTTEHVSHDKLYGNNYTHMISIYMHCDKKHLKLVNCANTDWIHNLEHTYIQLNLFIYSDRGIFNDARRPPVTCRRSRFECAGRVTAACSTPAGTRRQTPPRCPWSQGCWCGAGTWYRIGGWLYPGKHKSIGLGDICTFVL